MLCLFLASGAAVVQTECPSGSKCVAEHFCDANGVMSNSRVDLTQYEKEQRGEMIVSIFILVHFVKIIYQPF